MIHTRRDLRSEFNQKMSWNQYSMASEYLNEAVKYSDRALIESSSEYDEKIRNFLIYAKATYQDKGEYVCAKIMEECANYF